MRRAATPAWLVPLCLLAAAGCGQRIESALGLCGARSEADFVLRVRLIVERGPRAEKVYRLEMSPKLLVVGQERVEIGVRLVRGRNHVVFDEMTDSVSLRSRDGARVIEPMPGSTRVRGGALTATIESVDESMVGYWDVVVERADGEVPPVPFALRVVEQVRIAVTFDDGPTVEWDSSKRILDCLERERIKAAFFILSTADRNCWGRQLKADSDGGFDLLVREIRDGHVLGCHWGGDYGTQHATHPGRAEGAPYASDGNTFDDTVGPDGCALESDLIECMRTIEKAQAVAGVPLAPEFVRPPLWTYRTGIVNALPTYADLGLKMILTDSLARDGGYGNVPFFRPRGYLLTGGIEDAIREGHAEIVITAHDSNCRTGFCFETLLSDVRRKMAALGLEEGSEWRFVSDTDELIALLRRKRRFRSDIGLLMPDTTGGSEAGDSPRAAEAAPTSDGEL
ncbi:MAG: polysaccharide deacetylase family protein [Planctomycetota bacterium]